MNLPETKQIIRETLCKYPQLYFVSPPDPHIDILPHFMRWPDTPFEKCHEIRCDLNPELPFKNLISSELHFYYRNKNPAMAVNYFYVTDSHREKGFGRILVHAFEDIAHNLGCEERLFITEVTNPSWWDHMGFIPGEKIATRQFWIKKEFR